MLKSILIGFIVISLTACSSSKSPKEEETNPQLSELESEIFETENEVSDLETELIDDEGDDELDVSSSDDEFEDPDLTQPAVGVGEDELEISDEEIEEEDFDLGEDDLDTDVADTGDLDFDEGTDDLSFDDDVSVDIAESGDLEGSEDLAFDDLDENELDDELDLNNLDESVSSDDDFDLSAEGSDDDFDFDETSDVVDTGDLDFDDTSTDDGDLDFDNTSIGGIDDVTIEDDELIVENDLGSSSSSPLGPDGLPIPNPNKVLSLDYDSSVGGVFVIKTKEPSQYNTEFIPETNQYVVELKDTRIDKSLQRPFLTKDFKQSFGALNSYQDSDGDAKLVVQLKNDQTPYVTTNGSEIRIAAGTELEALTQNNQEVFRKQQELASKQEQALNATTLEDYLLENTNFYGKPISIQVKDANIIDVIHMISEEVGANLVVSESVTGKVSIKLKEVPWDQALITIMKTRGLGYVRSGSVLRIAPLSELQQESEAASAVQNARKSLTPFHVKVFPLSYASPETLETKLKPFLTQAGSTTNAAARTGQLISEARSSSIIVNDTKEVIENIEKLIKELDRPPLQVMIEAKVVEATKDFQKTIGSFFQSTAVTNGAGGGNFNLSNNSSWNSNNSSFFENSLSITGIDFFNSLNHMLRLNEISSKVKVLSAPKVLAINNEKAVIAQINQVLNRVITVQPNGPSQTTAQATDMELRLEVTPQITSDSNIIMDMLIRRQFAGTLDETLQATPVNTREAQNKVIVGNNKTAVIGGIYQTDKIDAKRGVPVLRKVPILKWIFGNENYRKTDSELMVFVTPRILNRNGRLAPVGKTPTASIKEDTPAL